MKATLSNGYCPTAVSPESITAAVPSRMALATSLASALVGSGRVIIDSSIWVAVIAGLPCSRAQRITRFWTSGTAERPISTPRSPRATITASAALTIVVELLERLGLLDLGDHERLRIRGVQELPQAAAVLCRADEGERDVVDAEREGELEVVQVLLGHRRDRDRDAGHVDSLVRAHGAADDDRGANADPVDLLDAQAHEPVVDEDLVPGLEDLGEHRREDGQVARRAVLAAAEDDRVALDEDPRALEVADPELRPLEVGDQRQRPAGTLLRVAQEPGPLAVLVVRRRARS